MRNKILLSVLLVRLLVSLNNIQAYAQGPTHCYADYVVSFSPGKDNNGEDVEKPENYSGVIGDELGDESSLSLGIGGEIILGFLNPVPVGAGDDLQIEERDDPGPLEMVNVYVFDGTDYVLVAENIPPDGAVDVNIAGLTEIKYVKLVDVSPESSTNGYDLDRLVALHGCGTPCDEADKPTAVLQNPDTQCPDGSASLEVSLTGTGPWKVGYTNGPDLREVLVTEAESSIPFDLAGNVQLAWVTDEANSCTSLIEGGESVFIADPAEGYFHSNQPKTVCNPGNGVWLSVVLKGKAQWSFTYTITHEGEEEEVTVKTKSTANIGKDKIVHQFKVFKPGVYTLISVSDACSPGTIDAEYSTVTVLDKPTATFIDTETVCKSDDETTLEVALTGMAPWELTWTVDGEEYSEADIQNPTFYLPVSTEGTYELQNIKSATDCEGIVLDDSIVTVLAVPTAHLVEKDTVLCDPEAVIGLTVELSGTAPYTFAYTRDGVTMDTVETSENEYTLLVSSLGTYALEWVQNSCAEGTVSGEANILAASQQMASFKYWVSDQTCNSATLELEAGIIMDGLEYRWYVDGEMIGQESKLQYQSSSPKTLTIALATANGYCKDSISSTVEIESGIATKLGRFQWNRDGEPTCDGQAYIFSSDSTHAEFTYQWKVDGKMVSEEELVAYTLAPGAHTVHLSLNDGHCLYSSEQQIEVAEFSIGEQADFEYMLLDALQCDTRMVEFAAGFDKSSYSYRWIINGEEVSQQSKFDYELPVGESEVLLEVSQGECSSSISKLIQIEDLSLTHAGAFDIAYESINCADWSLSASALDLGEEVQYQWWINGEPVEGQDQLHEILTPGDYTVRLRTEAGLCVYETEQQVNIPSAESLVNIPNVLSPQANHPDDRVIRVYGNCLSDEGFHLQVMNRWGGLVYETKSRDQAVTQGWDGGNQSAGIYTYTLRARFDNGTQLQKQGTITLLK